jgi:hypothetical protein
MTTSLDERQRLAAMGNVLRPDWPAGSLLTLITQDLKHRSYRDIAIALAVIATDPNTQTPGRLKEPGPWWEAARPVTDTAPRGKGRCPNCNGFHTAQSPCNVRNLNAHHRRPGAAMARAELAAHGIGRVAPTTTPEETE